MWRYMASSKRSKVSRMGVSGVRTVMNGVWVPKVGEGESPWQVWMLISYPSERSIPELTRKFISGPDEDTVCAKYPNISKQGVSMEDMVPYPMEYSPLGA